MNKRLADKIAIVTGAGCVGPGWGNGRATAFRFAQEGASVLAVDRNVASARDSLSMAGDGVDGEAFEADVTKSQTLQAAIWQDRKLSLSYHAGDGILSEQLVEPYGLVSTPLAWYLVGAVNGEKQVFCVSHLHEVASTAETFARPTSFDLSLYWTEYCQQPQAFSLTRPQQDQQKKLCFAPVPQQTKQKKEFLNPSFLPEQKKALNPSVLALFYVRMTTC